MTIVTSILLAVTGCIVAGLLTASVARAAGTENLRRHRPTRRPPKARRPLWIRRRSARRWQNGKPRPKSGQRRTAKHSMPR